MSVVASAKPWYGAVTTTNLNQEEPMKISDEAYLDAAVGIFTAMAEQKRVKLPTTAVSPEDAANYVASTAKALKAALEKLPG
jgi:hypothetical protein